MSTSRAAMAIEIGAPHFLASMMRILHVMSLFSLLICCWYVS
jgi:hypothetical protein